MRKSVVEQVTGKVLNVIEIEKNAKWSPPEGCILTDGGEIGDTWDGAKFINPEPVVEMPPVRDLVAEIDQLKTDIQVIKERLGTVL